MYDLILTDDKHKWPVTAFILLPSLPLSLISARLQDIPRSSPFSLPPVCDRQPRVGGVAHGLARELYRARLCMCDLHR